MNSPLSATLGARMNAYLTSSEDYKKQRQRVVKTMVRLRRDLGIITRDTKNYAAKQKTSTISADDYNKDSKYGLLLLLTAERDLLYAQEIKTKMEINSDDSAANQKALVVSRVKRATFTLKKLLEITAGESDMLRLELFVFAALAQGQLSTTKKQWAKVLNSLSIAKCASDLLKNNPELKVLLDDINDTIVEPSLKLALSQGGHEDAFGIRAVTRKHCHDTEVPYLSPAVDIIRKHNESLVTEKASEASLIKSVEWRGHRAQLYNDEVAHRIMELTSETDADLDSVITGWSQVLELHQQDVDLAQVNDDSDDLNKVQDYAILLTYIKYNMYFVRMKRDYTQAKNVSSVDQYRLFGRLVESTEQVKELPGVYKDEVLHVSLEKLQQYFTARKNVLLANVFKKLEKYAEALSVLHHTQEELLSVEEEWYKTEFPYDVTSNEEFDKFRKELASQLLEAHVLAQFLFELNTTNDKYSYLIENVDKCASVDKLINLDKDASLQPILCKPVLFDVAYNYINYGNQSSRAQPELDKGEDESKKRSGFFGIFGGRS